MSGPFEMVGEVDAPVCVDGVCALPTDAVEAAPAGAGTASDGQHT
ncbi:MAG: hypothetical protein P1U38_14095 [Aeromicrobium sp.]|nr:hypothetical protein [Aeromicrobium sp.]MDF1705897.1 hypothetical protein [Aeromicrobium sp.]